MKKMSRMATKKSYSWWWDSHISPKNSKWLEDNLEEMDRCVKEMLKLIEEEGDSFAKKAEMYYQRRPELIAHVEDFYRMYRGLAERYDNVTGELRRNIPSELQSQGSGSGSDFGSELTPERKPPRPKPGPRAAGFDFFLGSGGSSDHSRKGSDGSSSSSESDSDSDDSKDANGDDVSSPLHQRILELENELHDVKEKLHEYEGKDSHSRCGHPENGDHVVCTSKISALEEDIMVADEKLHFAEAEISSLKRKLEEKIPSSETGYVDPNLEKKHISELEELIAVMEAEISEYKKEIENLKGALVSANQQFAADISDRDNAIEECKTEISSLSKTYLLEKAHLEADVANLEGSIVELKTEIKSILQENSLLETKIIEQERMIRELQSSAASAADQFLQDKSALVAHVSSLSQSYASVEAKATSLEDVIKQLETERTQLCAQNGKHTEELNKNLDALKFKVDMLTPEKEELGAKVSALAIDVKCRDGQIYQMNEHLHQLHLEHAKLITEIEEARGAREELRSRVKELEEEVERQKAAVLDSAEGKREAIRQLCFSLEHYRDGYYQLRQVLQGHKRTAVIAH